MTNEKNNMYVSNFIAIGVYPKNMRFLLMEVKKNLILWTI